MYELLQKVKHLSGIATALSFLACYGTLAAVTLLAVLGLTLEVNAMAWTGAIVLFALFALISLAMSFWKHRRRWPIAFGFMGFSALVYALLIRYSGAIELFGFIALSGAAILDHRVRRSFFVEKKY